MTTNGNLNYKSMTKDELYDLLVAEFDNVRPEIKANVLNYHKHRTFEEWKVQLKLAFDDLVEYYENLLSPDIKVVQRLNSQHNVRIPRELQYHLRQYGECRSPEPYV